MDKEKLDELISSVCQILANCFNRSKDKDYIQITTKKVFGKNWHIIKDKEFSKSLSEILEKEHKLHLAIEANHKVIFVMSAEYFEKMQADGIKMSEDQYKQTLLGFNSYEDFLAHLNKQTQQ
jgi:hypothetical protein